MSAFNRASAACVCLSLGCLLNACSSAAAPELQPPAAGINPTAPAGTASNPAAVGGTGLAAPGAQPGAAAPGTVSEGTGAGSVVSPSTSPHLQWKRYAALEADLASALELAPDNLCTEFGGESCIRSVHMVPLGGYDPFVTGMLEAAAEPLATTPTVVERVVLSACTRRVDLDRQAGLAQARIFKFDLAGSAPAATSVSELSTTLYRRFLARDPEAQETAALGELAVDDAGQAIAAAEFAQLACFVVGTASEFLFF